MFRIFAYTKISTIEQIPENQIRQIETAGFAIKPHRVIAKTISRSRAIAQRKGVLGLFDKMEKRDVQVIIKPDRGIMTMNVIISAVAQFGRDRLVGEKIESGKTVSAFVRQSNNDKQIIMRVRRHT